MEQIETTIRPPANISINLKELWQYRELFYFFTWRDIKVKYKQTFLGIAWALIQPLAMMLLFTFIFSRTLKLDFSINIPYPVFVLSGIIIWNLFNGAVSHAGESMIANSGIIKKIYFPRLIIPFSAILVNLFDFLMAFIVSHPLETSLYQFMNKVWFGSCCSKEKKFGLVLLVFHI